MSIRHSPRRNPLVVPYGAKFRGVSVEASPRTGVTGAFREGFTRLPFIISEPNLANQAVEALSRQR